VLRVGPTAGQSPAGHGADDADMAVFVDRLATAGSDRCTAQAKAQVRARIDAGITPPGLRRLAEALAASVGEPPSQRRPADEPGSVVSAVRETSLVVLEEFGPEAVAGALAALLADGRRVVVAGGGRLELAAVRNALPAAVADLALDRQPPLPPAEVRELRRLLATSTPERRARRDQQLPADDALPPLAEVTELCTRVGRAAAGGAAGLIPGLLAQLDPERREAVTSVARCVGRSLGALDTPATPPWAWTLLSDLIYSRHRATFDRMLEDTAQASEALAAARETRPVTLLGPLPEDSVDVLIRYLEFLKAGGRSRSYFRSSAQRDAQPVLRQILVDGQAVESSDDLRLVLHHLEFGERLRRVEAGCAELGIAPPRSADDLAELTDVMGKVAAAARSVGALRHDVLFIHPNSPVVVPDVAAAGQIAAAILVYADQGSAAEAGRALERMAADLAERAPVAATSPEHERAVAALRAHDAVAYGEAVDALVGARREVQDEARRVALLERLRQGAPKLAQAWSDLAENGSGGLGVACFVPMEQVLAVVPPADSADIVVVLGAARLGVERLLLTAVAPRLVAVVGPGERANGSPSMLSVLHRASALVIRGGAGRPAQGRVVPLGAGARPAPAPARTQAGG
jgi:hypothetical protein